MLAKLLKMFLQEVQAASSSRIEPYKGYNFLVDIVANINGTTENIALGFQKVSGLRFDIEVAEYREGGDPAGSKNIPGLPKHDPITLERGLGSGDTTDAMWRWADSCINSESEVLYTGEMIVTLRNRAGVAVKKWSVSGIWVSGYELGDLDALSNNVLIERVTLQHDGIKKMTV